MEVLKIAFVCLFFGTLMYFIAGHVVVEHRVNELKEDFRRLLSIRLEGAETERRLHDVDRAAFEEMIRRVMVQQDWRGDSEQTVKDAKRVDGRA